MKIIFAQGNPGTKYKGTRHNIGHDYLDTLAQQWGISFVDKPKFQAQIAETTRRGEKVMLVKPTTYYNETGLSARALIDFYKLDPAKDFVVIHDELMLPFGTIRTREKGRDAGNNGIKSLNAHIGTTHNRIRVGVYHETRNQIHDADFVLGKFSAQEQSELPKVFAAITQFVEQFVNNAFAATKISVLPATPQEE